jgi:ribosomal protein S20
MIQASTTRDPIIRLERDDATVATAQQMAAPRPPRIAITGEVCRVARALGATATLCYHPRSRPALTSCRGAHLDQTLAPKRFAPVAKTPRTWTGARTPSGLKRVRQAARRHEVLGPRRSAAKTYVAKALTVAAAPADGQDPAVALSDALSALDRAAKAGAIHPNAAARRKSRLTKKVNAALGGAHVQTSGHVTKQTSKAAAAKAAKARIAAGKSAKAKGAQTAAGKARAALSKTARAEAAAAAAAAGTTPAAAEAPAKPAKGASTAKPKAAAKTTTKASTTKTATAKKAAPKKAAADKS